MFEWFNALAACASSWKRRKRSGSAAKDWDKTFSATSRFNRVSRFVNFAHCARADRREDLLRNNPRSGSRLILQRNESVAKFVGLAL